MLPDAKQRTAKIKSRGYTEELFPVHLALEFDYSVWCGTQQRIISIHTTGRQHHTTVVNIYFFFFLIIIVQNNLIINYFEQMYFIISDADDGLVVITQIELFIIGSCFVVFHYL